MEEILNQVIQACRLSRELESSLPHIAANNRVLLASCEQVFFAFNKAVYDLRGFVGGSSSSYDPAGHMITGEGVMEDWSQFRVAESMPTGQMGYSQLGLDIQAPGSIGEREFVAVGGGGRFAGGGEEYLREPETEDGRRSGGPVGSAGQRASRRRRESGDTRTVRISALRPGNSELPPDDGYTWRKYGQKAILGSSFPRSYFRCTHKNFYGCKAKRKVQRLDADPNTYEITYCGNHTCQTSPTPMILPSIKPATTNENMTGDVAVMAGVSPAPTSTEPSGWFLKEIESEVKAYFSSPFLSSHEGPSNQPQPVRTGREPEGSVADLADVMFNSGSSSNSMDTIFTFKTDE